MFSIPRLERGQEVGSSDFSPLPAQFPVALAFPQRNESFVFPFVRFLRKTGIAPDKPLALSLSFSLAREVEGNYGAGLGRVRYDASYHPFPLWIVKEHISKFGKATLLPFFHFDGSHYTIF